MKHQSICLSMIIVFTLFVLLASANAREKPFRELLFVAFDNQSDFNKIQQILPDLEVVHLTRGEAEIIVEISATEEEKITLLHLSTEKFNIRFLSEEPQPKQTIGNGFHKRATIPSDVVIKSYHNYIQLTAELHRIHAEYPTITSLYSIGTSAGNRSLWVMEISDNPETNEEDEPQFKYIANMHGDETVGREMLLALIEHLCIEYKKNNSDIQWLVNNTQIYLMPTMNPDGYENRRRENQNFYDLNRNFPDQFKPSTQTLQPETSAVMSWTLSKNFVLSANMHGGALVANYPWDGTSNRMSEYSKCPDDALFQHLALTYSQTHGEMYRSTEFSRGITNGAEWYALYGGMQDWNYIHADCFEITLELSDVKNPQAIQLQSFWETNLPPMLAYMKKVHMGIKGKVMDASGKGIPDAAIQVANNEKIVQAHKLSGVYFRLLMPGTYDVTASAPGYQSLTQSVVVDENSKMATVLNFTLQVKNETAETTTTTTNNDTTNNTTSSTIQITTASSSANVTSTPSSSTLNSEIATDDDNSSSGNTNHHWSVRRIFMFTLVLLGTIGLAMYLMYYRGNNPRSILDIITNRRRTTAYNQVVNSDVL